MSAFAEWSWPTLDELAAEQDQVASRAQLADLGIDRWRIRNQVAARRWQTRGRYAVILHAGPLSLTQQQWVAVTNAGPSAALAGLTAAAAAGLRHWPRSTIHVVVPHGTRLPSRVARDPRLDPEAVREAPVKLHVSRRLRPEDLHLARPLRQTTIERSLVDAAVWERDVRPAAGILAAGVQQRLVSASDLRAELLRAGAVRHRRQLELALLDIEGGSHSLAEIDFYRLCRRWRLPLPDRQVMRNDRAGRRRYLDAYWESARLIAEVDGAIHLRAWERWNDMQRENSLVLDGYRLLHFASVAVRTDEAVVADQLRRALGL